MFLRGRAFNFHCFELNLTSLLHQGRHLHSLKKCLTSLHSLLVAKELQHVWCFQCGRTILSQWTFDVKSVCEGLFASLSFFPFIRCLILSFSLLSGCVWCHSVSFIPHTQIPSSSQITLLKYRHYQHQTSRHPEREREWRDRQNEREIEQ